MNTRRHRPLLLALVLLLTVQVAVGADATTLRVTTFNIWHGGEQVSFTDVVEVIRRANPDIIGIQEADGNLRELARQLGYGYYDERRYLLSKYPLFELSPPQREAVLAMVTPGGVVAIANVHLYAEQYGPELIHHGSSAASVLNSERATRGSEVEPYAQALASLHHKNIPVILTGDFNTPSHQDWTPASVGKLPQIKFAMDWPTTRVLANLGLHDTYRDAHPDPVSNPGITWTPGYPHPLIRTGELLDRIDMIWIGGPARTLASDVVGEETLSPYPSDHRAVLSTISVQPAPQSALIAVERPVLRQGEDFLVRVHVPDQGVWRVALVTEGTPVSQSTPGLSAPLRIALRRCVKLTSTTLSAGPYEAVLTDDAGRELARTPFHVLSSDATPEITTQQTAYQPGEAISVSWRNAPGNKGDWIAILSNEHPDPYKSYLTYQYTGSAVEGAVPFETGALPVGDYKICLLRDDSGVVLATAYFRITLATN